MVRVVGEDGSQLGIMSISEALNLARSRELDLVEVAPTAKPPVCRIMDYGRYKYEQAKRMRKARSRAHQMQIKEVKMGVKIGDHDFMVKVNQARGFLQKRDKVKFTIRFRGREIQHRELGDELLKRVIQELTPDATVEVPIRQEGRFLMILVAPKAGS
jgi:translation initiation factor IF-3